MGLFGLFSGKGPSGPFGKVLKAKTDQELGQALSQLKPDDLLDGVPETPASGLSAEAIRNFFGLAQALLRANLGQSPTPPYDQLPQGLDTEALWKAIFPRMLAILKESRDSSVAKQGARDVAAILIEQSGEQEAARLLLAARPGVAPDHEYLLLRGLASLVQDGSDPQAPEMFQQMIQAIQEGQVPIPEDKRDEVDRIIRKAQGGEEETEEVEPPMILDVTDPGEKPCDRCANNAWKLPNMKPPTAGDLKAGRKLVCPQCGRVGVYQPPD
jgi:hypothetical protein